MYDYGYNDYSYATDGAAEVLGVFAIILIIVGIITLGVSIFQIIAYWKMYKKAGKGGWEAIVPYYCNYVLVEIAGLNWWWFLFFFAPLVLSFVGLGWLGSIVILFVSFNCFYNISKRFNKGVGFAVCFTLFTPICAAILAFSKKETYNANIPVSPNGVFGTPVEPTQTAQQPVQQPTPVAQQPVQQPTQPAQQPVQSESQPLQSLEPNYQQPVQPTVDNSVPQAGPKFCTTCGNPIVDNAKFCTKCGNQL